MTDKKDIPREAEIVTVNCFCDHCKCSLDNRKTVWVWNEHFGCSRNHVQLAQAATNREYEQRAFKRSDEVSEKCPESVTSDADYL